jgi:diguanylate cyclase (GGDEF)-like protein
MTERAYHDPLLAGVYNRAAFHERLTQEILRFARYHRAVSLILFDLDYFKRINDTHGHQVGDSTLKTLAARVQVALRAPDFFARFGGDEFALILPDTSLSGAVLLAERLSRLVANTRFPYETHELYVSLSLGVATIHSDDTVETVLERADRALYLAKERGRNQVRSEEELPPPPASTLDKVKRFLPRNWGLQRRTKEE